MRAAIISLGGELFTIDLLNVREVFVVESITPVPGMPSGLVGVTNLRGTVVPLLDLRPMFSLNAGEPCGMPSWCNMEIGRSVSSSIRFRKFVLLPKINFCRLQPARGKGVSLRVDRCQVGGSAPGRVGNVGDAFISRGDELTREQQAEISRNSKRDQREEDVMAKVAKTVSTGVQGVRRSQDQDKADFQLRYRQRHYLS